MSSHSNFKKEKCWSCIFYAGNRKISSFLSKSIITDSYGMCTCKKCSDSGKRVSEDHSCSKWQIDPLTCQCQIDEANKKAEKEARAEADRQKREIEHQQWQAEMRQRDAEREMERERRRLEEERKKLEYECWYSTLSSEDKKIEDARIAKKQRIEKEREAELERQAEIKRQQEEEKRIEEEKKRAIKKAKIKKRLIIGGISFAGIVAIIIAIVCISNAIKQKQAEEAFENSDTGKLIALIQEETGGKNEFYFSVDRDEGCKAYFGFEYKKNGWTDNYGQSRDFRVYCQFTARASDNYTKSTGFCFFNLDGSENTNTRYLNGSGACFTASAIYGTNSQVITQYQSVKYSSVSSKITYASCYYTYEKWNSSYNSNINEWTERGFTACDLVNTLIEQYCVSAFGSSFWK